MDRLRAKVSLILALLPVLLLTPSPSLSAGTTPAASPVKLVFIHHSTGGNWLAAPNEDQPYGDLGAALMANNYYVSATNYGWGPNGIGDRTDIPNWPEWFTGQNSAAVLAALYGETGQNTGDFGAWPRLAADPGGENTVVLFKSCFPNSDLFGEPDDPPAAQPGDQFTVANAKAVYNDLLIYFTAHPEKLFVAVTAPPQLENDYSADYQIPAHRAANARAFNNWLVHEWLAGYPHPNIAVFDYFNVLTHPDNHHRVVGGTVEHVTSPESEDFAYYPNDAGTATLARPATRKRPQSSSRF